MRLSKRHKAEVDLLVAQMTTPFGKNLSKKPKPQVYPAYLPDDVGTHGNTTGNAAEVSHRMFEAVRGQQSLYKSLRTAVEVMHRRKETLRDEYVHQTALCLGKQEVEVSIEAPAPDDLIIPAVHKELRKQSAATMSLTSCTADPHVAGQAPSFTVQDGDDKFTVTPSALLDFKWDSACGCQKNANVPLFCKHVQRALADVKGDAKQYVKPWSRPEAWRRQTAVVWTPPGAHEAIEGVRELHDVGQVRVPIHPSTTSSTYSDTLFVPVHSHTPRRVPCRCLATWSSPLSSSRRRVGRPTCSTKRRAGEWLTSWTI